LGINEKNLYLLNQTWSDRNVFSNRLHFYFDYVAEDCIIE